MEKWIQEFKDLEKIVMDNSDMVCAIEENGKDEYVAELSWYSRAGEDCHEYIHFDGTAEDFRHKLYEYNWNYPEIAEENARAWIDGQGAPDMFELVEDAKDKIECFDNWTTDILKAVDDYIEEQENG